MPPAFCDSQKQSDERNHSDVACRFVRAVDIPYGPTVFRFFPRKPCRTVFELLARATPQKATK